ncbi:hypothetical protein [Flagellimonas amoyensis]|uniref:hypothetical protein n=1 Tax=Flagellimonas amoyensis TaxID=2169401 RepID=UPI000D3B5B5C|nr:hypothetical protein [Allomuricauda amoyensis]
MKTIKSLFFTTLSAILLVSCSKDDDGGNQPLQTLLSKRITDSETLSYTYDSNNRATGYSSENPVGENNYSVTYRYNSSGQMVEANYTTTSGTYTKIVYLHNNNGQLTQIETYMVTAGVATLESKSEADYSTTGKVSVYRTTLSGTPYLNTEYYLDPNGNITSQLSYDASGLLIVTSVSSNFDDKKTASASLPDESFARNKNNYGTVAVTPTGGSSNISNFMYEYNDDGYPTKRTSNVGSIVTYEYIKR